MGFIFTGSVALQSIISGIEPNDVDAIADIETATKFLNKMRCNVVYPANRAKYLIGKTTAGEIYEVEIAWPGSTGEELLEYVGDAQLHPSLDVLYALKMSHRYLRNSPHFHKTRQTIFAMRNAGAKIPEDLKDWFKRREKETYDYGHPNLAQNKNNFFSGDGVNYVYDHDTIHEAVAIWEQKPMYKRYQKDGSEVLCDKAKWDKLPNDFKNMAVAEEAAVLAIERSLVPFPGAKTPYEALTLALEKICTSITSGWFREYAWENYDAILQMCRVSGYDYWGKFQQALKLGYIKPYKKEENEVYLNNDNLLKPIS